ncbi:RND transporter, HAE1/HME family, permease protein [Ehrlichia ruminantium]|uniref:RND transporter, HAE1/HME family, permease protein n=1 Tax=Ehrlichia ruminantium TaxID=779 RepID=A0A170R1J1_EHRRU|nr:RND transporter, HAE1/HME family, permease protein [Ehrlichia ruminantium]GAT77787.1 RND transporter, HAE1/HME family, permease protein [Ehrlichia ruminantium]GAT78978.1 RND transporter, HAE1/HME family, permease protein [Ehrlichia ruminantium]
MITNKFLIIKFKLDYIHTKHNNKKNINMLWYKDRPYTITYTSKCYKITTLLTYIKGNIKYPLITKMNFIVIFETYTKLTT